MKGQLVLVLDNNQQVTLNEGDVVVQRGTWHSWRNETGEWARIIFVGLGRSSSPTLKDVNTSTAAESIQLRNGEELKEDLSELVVKDT